MSYIVTARKWRPMVFGDVIGQSHITTTLMNAIATERVHHAYIFGGPRGIGKTTTARILAKAINCLHPKDANPDNTCELCMEITEGRSVHVFEIDGASNRGIEEIRSLREAVRYSPSKGKYKVYIIDEVHMLTPPAFNALLKTLEEPPSYVVFVFATTEIHKVPITILSRCQRFDFRRVTVDEIIGRLKFISGKENITIDNEALFLLAHKADGSMRDAQSLFDQVVSFCGMTIDAASVMQALNLVNQEYFFRVSSLIASKSSTGMLSLVEEILSKGYDVKEFLNGLIEHLRNLLVARATGSVKFIEASEEFKKRYASDCVLFTEYDLLRLLKIATETEAAIKWSQQPRYKFEIALLNMVKIDSSVEIGQLLQQLEEIKQQLKGTPLQSSQSELSSEANLFGDSAQRPKLQNTIVTKQPQRERASEILSQVSAEQDIPYTSQLQQPASVLPQISSQLHEQHVVSLSMDDAMNKWSSLIHETRKQKVAVGTMLSESRLYEVKENRLHIACPDDFHLETFKRNREFLFKLAETVYGAKVRLEAIVEKDTLVRNEPPVRETASSTSAPKSDNDLLNNPVTQFLIKEFDCIVVE